jgi:hydrogenase maturation protein HypF
VLRSTAAPIVLLEPTGHPGLAANISEASPYFGVMLPYSPLHHLLLRAFPHAVVATSGNISGDPIAIDAPPPNIADLVVAHNRPIARPVDDSVVRVARGRECVLRRARGYAPLPVRVSRALPPLLAVGAHLKSAVAIAIGHNVYLSQHIGDLDTYESRRAFASAIDDLCRLYRFRPEAVACDLHPDYASTAWARESGLPVIAVQHHQAHAASCAAENDVRGPYLAVAWDGTGYGLDGAIWGGEFFAVEGERMERVAHLRPFRLPGGEAAIKEGWRTAEALRFELRLPPAHAAIRRMLERNLNTPLTTSVGRLFDAVAAFTGVASESRFEGEAAMRLERAATGDGAYEIPGGDWQPLIEAVIAEPDPHAASARFHRALANWILAVARETGLPDVVLSGGCFQNALLTGLTCELLEAAGYRVHTHQRVPPNDGGIALGQAVLAAGTSSSSK